MKTKILSLMLIASSIFLFSCKEEEEFTSGKLKQSSVTLNVGESAQLEYSGIGVTWESGDTQIASVTDDGVVTGVHVGKTTLRANWSACEVNVKSKNNFYVDPIIEDFEIRKGDVSTYFSNYKKSYSKTHTLLYSVNTSTEVDSEKFDIYDANVTDDPADATKFINLNYYPELSPEKTSDVNDKSLKTVLRYVYMYDKNTQNKIDAAAIVLDYSNKELLFNYLRDRYMVVSDDDAEEQEFKSIDGKVFVKTKAIDEQSRDKNYNYSVFVEDAYIVAMFVPNSGEESNDVLFKELEKGVKESYLRNTYSVSITVNTEEAGSISIKNIKGGDLTEGQMIQYGKIVIAATANEGYKFAGWFKKESDKLTVVSYQISDTITVVEKIDYVAVFDKPFEVKVSSSEGGSAKISTAIEVDKTILNVTKYEPITFKAEVAEGYKFVNWTDAEGNILETKAEFEKTLEGAIEYKANFEVATCNIEVKLEGEGIIEGDIINGEETIKMIFAESSLTGVAKYGQKINVTATEIKDSKYLFIGWKSGEKIISSEKTYSMIATKDSIFSAVFDKIKCKVTVEATKGGSVLAPKNTVEVAFGEKVDLEVKAKSGYKFIKWLDKDGNVLRDEENNVITSQKISVEVKEEAKFTAVFTPMPCDVSINLMGEGSIQAVKLENGVEAQSLKIDGCMNNLFYGDTIKLKVVNVSENSYFNVWRLTKYKEWETLNEENERITKKEITSGSSVSKEKEYLAILTPSVFECDIIRYNEDAGTEFIDPEVKKLKLETLYYNAVIEKYSYNVTISAEEGGKIEGKDYERVEHGNTTTFKIKADAEYELAGLFANGEEIMNFKDLGQTEYSYTTDPIYKNVNYTVTFAKVKYDVAVVAGEGGVITSDEQIKVTSGEQTTIQAKAAEGYRFVNWTVGDEVVSKSNPYTTAPITKDMTYKANFEKL